MRCAGSRFVPARPPRPLAHGKVPGPDVSPGPPAGHEGLSSRRHFIFVGFLRRERRLQQILLQQPHNEFADELADLHVPERRLERESPDHVLSKRQFSRSLLAPVPHPDGDGRRARLTGPLAGHEGLPSRRHFTFVGFLRREHRLQPILLQQPHNEFADELADLHVAERRLERESPDHVLSERQFSRSLLAPVLHLDGEARRGRLIRSVPALLARSGFGFHQRRPRISLKRLFGQVQQRTGASTGAWRGDAAETRVISP